MSNSMPASLKGGPFTTNAVPATKYNLFGFVILWLSSLPIIFLLSNFLVSWTIDPIYLYFMFPVQLMVYYLLFVLFSQFWGWVFLKIANLLHAPYEGYFKRDMKDKNYRYWIIRANIKRVPIWVAHNCPFPWMDILAYKMYGNIVPISTALFDSWTDAEFLEIGSGTTIGQGAVVMTSMVTRDYLIIKRVRIGSRCLVGSQSVIMPGTTMNDDCMVGALTMTSIDQELESGWLYIGRPAEKFKELEIRDKDDMTPEERATQKIFQQIVKEYPTDEKGYSKSVMKAIKKAAKEEAKAENQRAKAETRMLQAQEKQQAYAAKARKYLRNAEKRDLQVQIRIAQATRLMNSNRLQSDYHDVTPNGIDIQEVQKE